MAKNFRRRLTLILIGFTLLLTILIALFDYEKLKEQVHIGQYTKLKMAENRIIDSLTTIDKVYNLFDYQIADKMKTVSEELLEKYEEDPDFSSWDFKQLNKTYEMDIFILNEENQVIHSSLTDDVGLNFKQCCKKFSKLLDDRRNGYDFYDDGMDIQSSTGEIKKFSYMPTPDHRYLIELGYSLENETIFNEFNFLETIETLEEQYGDVIQSIRIYNSGGFLLGQNGFENTANRRVGEQFLPAFTEARSSKKSTKVTVDEKNKQLTHQFIPYSADESRGFSTMRVVEIVSNDAELSNIMELYQEDFILRLFALMIVIVSLSMVIAKLVAEPVHLAFHDGLTGLKNRVAFEEAAREKFEKKKKPIAFMIVDLDNFKAVNDLLGHMEGDRILKMAALEIENAVGNYHTAARLGGDEFIIQLTNVLQEQVEQIASDIIRNINEHTSLMENCDGINPSVSIGIAFADQNDTFETLYKKADEALYQSKDNGKDQYNIYV